MLRITSLTKDVNQKHLRQHQMKDHPFHSPLLRLLLSLAFSSSASNALAENPMLPLLCFLQVGIPLRYLLHSRSAFFRMHFGDIRTRQNGFTSWAICNRFMLFQVEFEIVGHLGNDPSAQGTPLFSRVFSISSSLSLITSGISPSAFSSSWPTF